MGDLIPDSTNAQDLPVPVAQDEVTPGWLGAALGGAGVDTSVRALTLERIGEGYGLSSRLFLCRWGGAGDLHSAVVKLWGTDGPAGTREVDFYRVFGGRAGARIPRCYHGAIDRAARRGVLLLEDLGPVIQGDCLERLPLSRASDLARETAALHAAWWARPEVTGADWLPSVAKVERGSDWLESRRALLLDRYSDRLSGFTLELLGRLPQVEARSNDRLTGAAESLLHGDLHLDNVVFLEESGRPVILDWARCTRGPAAVDLVQLLFVNGHLEDEETIFGVYADELRRRGVSDLDDGALHHQVGGALLRAFITWTCGLARWEPASDREVRMIHGGLERVQGGVIHWRRKDPDLFHF